MFVRKALLENNVLAEIKLCNLSGSDWKLNGCLGKNGWQICQKRIPRDKRILLRKMKFLSKKKIRFWIHLLNYSETRLNKLLCALIRQGCQNWNLRAQGPFWKTFRNKSSFFILFLDFFAKNLNWTHKLRFARKAFYVSSGTFQGTFLRRNQNFGHRAKKYLFLASRYWQSCQNSFPCVQRNILRKMNFSRKIRIFDFFYFHQKLL